MQEMQELRIQSLGQEDPLEYAMVTWSGILAWEILWREEPRGLQSIGLQRVEHDLATKHTCTLVYEEQQNKTKSSVNSKNKKQNKAKKHSFVPLQKTINI